MEDNSTTPTPYDYRDSMELLQSAIEFIGRAAGCLWPHSDAIEALAEPLRAKHREIGAHIAGAFCKLCGHYKHANDRCEDRAPNPEFSCGCLGPCPHGKIAWYCKECRQLGAV